MAEAIVEPWVDGMEQPEPVAWDIPGFGDELGSLEEPGGRKRLRAHLAYEIENALDEASAAAPPEAQQVDPALPQLRAVLVTRASYADDEKVSQHLMRMAAILAKPPHTNEQAAYVRGLVGEEGLEHLKAARVEFTTQLRQASGSINNPEFGSEWFVALSDLSIAMGTSPWLLVPREQYAYSGH